MSLKKAFLFGAIGSLGASGLLGILALLGAPTSILEEVIFTTLCMSYFSLAALACAWGIDQNRFVWLAYPGLVLSLMGFAWCVGMIWFDRYLDGLTPNWRGEEEVMVFSFLISAFLAYSVLLLLPIKPAKWAARTRLLGLIAATIFTVWAAKIIFAGFDADEMEARFLGVLGIVSVGSGLAFPILLKVGAIQRIEEMGTTALDVDVRCPRCGVLQVIKASGVPQSCSVCKLRLKLEIEEPTCPDCGYLLYQLESPRCPECGREIAPETEWTKARVNSDSAGESSVQSAGPGG